MLVSCGPASTSARPTAGRRASRGELGTERRTGQFWELRSIRCPSWCNELGVLGPGDYRSGHIPIPLITRSGHPRRIFDTGNLPAQSGATGAPGPKPFGAGAANRQSSRGPRLCTPLPSGQSSRLETQKATRSFLLLQPTCDGLHRASRPCY